MDSGRLQPALLGGVFIGVLSALPFIGAGNCCCCMWVLGGGILSVYLRQQNSPAPLEASEGALLGLMAAGETGSDAVSRGIAYLEAAPRDGARWREELYNAVGFPRVFYLRYHGYSVYFPIWALARYRNLRRSNAKTVVHGI